MNDYPGYASRPTEPVLSAKDTATGAFAFLAFLLCIPAANWLIGHWGTVCPPDSPCLVPVGFGMMAPSGVIVIGLALVLRDIVHEKFGLWGALGAVAIGGVVSLAISPWSLAVAAVSAFILSELADTLVYTPLRRRHRPLAVIASQLVGAIVDSYLFVRLAFGSFEFAAGQAWAKFATGVIVAIVLWAYLRMRGRPLNAE